MPGDEGDSEYVLIFVNAVRRLCSFITVTWHITFLFFFLSSFFCLCF